MSIFKGKTILTIMFSLNKALIAEYITYLKLKRNKKDRHYKSKLAF
jgi:hypothetical protein